jgi:hypothetical protein
MLQKVEVNISNEIGVHSMNNILTTKHNVRAGGEHRGPEAYDAKNGSEIYGTELALWPKQKRNTAMCF